VSYFQVWALPIPRKGVEYLLNKRAGRECPMKGKVYYILILAGVCLFAFANNL
jgi:hypothetical protein